MADYKLSIIIPTYNLEKVIAKTFHSVQSQTLRFDDIELIFVDDCSEDKTLNILKNYEKHYSNVKLFTTDKNSGFAGKPRNIGLINSNSDYILFLDGDDQLLIDSCETLYNNITSTQSDIVIGGHINRYENGKLEHNSPLYSGRNEIFTNVQDANLLNITPAISAKLFKRELLIKNNIEFKEGIPGQDLVFLVESILNSNKISVLNNFYVYYRNINDDSVSFNLNENYLKGLIQAYKLVCDLFEKHSVSREIQDIILANHMGFLTTQLIRSSSSSNFEESTLRQIVNSQSFNELSNENIFKNNELYVEFFENIQNETYNNRPLLSKIRENTNTNLINGHHGLENQINKLSQINQTLNNENKSLKSNNDILIQTQDKLKTQNETLTNEKNTLQNNLNNLSEANNNLVQFQNELKIQNEDLTKINKTLNEENNSLKSDNDNLILTQDKLKTQNETLTNEKNTLQNNLNTITNEKNTLQNNLTKALNDHKALKNHAADLTYENKKLTENINNIKNENNNLNDKFVEIQNLNSKARDDLYIFKNEFNSLKKLQIRIDDENKFLKNKNKNLNDELDEIKSSLLWKIKNIL